MRRLRVSVVAPVPEPLGSQIDAIRIALGERLADRVAAHLTVVSPVNIPEHDLNSVVRAIREVARRHDPVDVEIGPVRTFLPDASAVYLAVDDGAASALGDLRDQLSCGPLNRPTDAEKSERLFVPHITLVRGLAENTDRRVRDALARYEPSPTVLDRLQLVAEHYGDEGGREWEVLFDVVLGPARIVGRGGLPLELSDSETLPPDAGATAGWPQPQGEDPVVLTARRDDRVVGVAVGNVDGRRLEISELVVAADVRAEGIGARLLDHALRVAEERGLAEVTAVDDIADQGASFLRRHGWTDGPLTRRTD